jgi:CRP-like cAMP-binding protein
LTPRANPPRFAALQRNLDLGALVQFTPAIAKVMRESALFRGLSDTALARLAEIGSEREWQQGAILFSKGDPANSIQLVVEGRVSIREVTADGRSLTLAIFSVGEVIGEVGVVDGRPRSADAVADSLARVFIVERRHFLSYLENHPTLAIRLMQTICARLRETNELVEGMAFRTVRARVAQRLLSLAQGANETPPPKIQDVLPLTGQELADYCALTRESVSKQLARWREQGIVSIARGRISLLDMAALEVAAGDAD